MSKRLVKQQHKISHRKIAREVYWDMYDPAEYNCPDCGRTERELKRGFEIHHLNGDPLDNRLENLVGLCRLCHMVREGKKPSLDQIKRIRSQLKGDFEPENERNPDDEDTEEDGRDEDKPLPKEAQAELAWTIKHEREIPWSEVAGCSSQITYSGDYLRRVLKDIEIEPGELGKDGDQS